MVRHLDNQGLGATIRDGLAAAAEAARPDEIIITMDAGETHTPGLIPRMVRMIQEGHDVVIASRFGAASGARHLRRAFYRSQWLASDGRYDMKKGAGKMRVMRTARQTLAPILRRRFGNYC